MRFSLLLSDSCVEPFDNHRGQATSKNHAIASHRAQPPAAFEIQLVARARTDLSSCKGKDFAAILQFCQRYIVVEAAVLTRSVVEARHAPLREMASIRAGMRAGDMHA